MVLYLLLCASALSAQDTVVVSLTDVQRRVLEKNPAFLSEQQSAEIARGELKQARVYPLNPELSIEIPGASSSPTDDDDYRASLTQGIEWAGQRGLRIRAAQAGVTRADAAVRNAARLGVAEASVAFYRALAAKQRLKLAEDVLALNQRLLEAVHIQLREGEISALEGNLAEIEFGRARARVLAVRREVNATTLQLKRLLAIPSYQEIRLVDDNSAAPSFTTLSIDSLVTEAHVRRPDLAMHRTAIREFDLLGQLARRDGIPVLQLSAVAERDREGGNPRIGVGVGFALPIFSRNQGVIAQRRAQSQQALLEARAVELQIREEVATAVQAYAAASEETLIFETSVLEPARRNSQLLEAAYRAGKLALPTLLLLRNQLLEAELGYWDAWLTQREALVQLQAAIGELPVRL
jgi:cobalt-zinc-cadmium efflux system outer membrane protein